MTKTLNQSSYVGFLSLAFTLALFLFLTASTQVASAAINSQLQLGSKGTEVTELQQFLVSESSIYPSAIVSGYYGPLTAAAVTQFQVAYDLPQVGRVGPMTQEVINDVMSTGSGDIDIRGPVMSNNSIQVGSNSVTINWFTNEVAKGKVFYSTSPIEAQEATLHAQQPTINATSVVSTNLNNSQSFNIQGLMPNTLYYYMNVASDASGNVSVSPRNTFRTNN